MCASYPQSWHAPLQPADHRTPLNVAVQPAFSHATTSGLSGLMPRKLSPKSSRRLCPIALRSNVQFGAARFFFGPTSGILKGLSMLVSYDIEAILAADIAAANARVLQGNRALLVLPRPMDAIGITHRDTLYHHLGVFGVHLTPFAVTTSHHFRLLKELKDHRHIGRSVTPSDLTTVLFPFQG